MNKVCIKCESEQLYCKNLCIKCYNKQYYSKNKEKIISNVKRYAIEHLGLRKEYEKKYCIDNADKIKLKKRRYYLKNKKRIDENAKLFKNNHNSYDNCVPSCAYCNMSKNNKTPLEFMWSKEEMLCI